MVTASCPDAEYPGCEQSALEQMMQDQYGNYVVQKTLEVSRWPCCAAVLLKGARRATTAELADALCMAFKCNTTCRTAPC
jgi:hypothetical protein